MITITDGQTTLTVDVEHELARRLEQAQDPQRRRPCRHGAHPHRVASLDNQPPTD